MKDLIFIERKASPAELAKNIFEKRFERLLENIKDIKYRYIVCEFSIDKLLSFPYGNGLPSYAVNKIRVKGALLLSKLQKYEIDYGVHVVFCSNQIYAQQYILSLFKKIYKLETSK
jgi:hypothetical protein